MQHNSRRASWRRKDKENIEADNQNDYASQQTYGSEAESENCLMLSQNHEAKKAWGTSHEAIIRLRDDRRRLLQDGDIRHKAFRDAHRHLNDRSDIKRRQNNLSDDELKSMILDKIARSAKHTDNSQSQYQADCNSKSKSSITITNLLAEIDQNSNNKSKSLDNKQYDELANIDQKCIDMKNEMIDQANILMKSKADRGRDLKLEDICYTKSKGNLTDREQVLITLGDNNIWQASNVDRCIHYDDIDDHRFDIKDDYNCMVYHDDEGSFDASLNHDIQTVSLDALNLIHACNDMNDLGNHEHISMISVSDKEQIAESELEIMENSINANISKDEKRYDFTSKTAIEVDGRHNQVSLTQISHHSHLPKSRATLLMESLALKMEAMQKRAESLRKTNENYELEHTSETHPQILDIILSECQLIFKSESECYFSLLEPNLSISPIKNSSEPHPTLSQPSNPSITPLIYPIPHPLTPILHGHLHNWNQPHTATHGGHRVDWQASYRPADCLITTILETADDCSSLTLALHDSQRDAYVSNPMSLTYGPDMCGHMVGEGSQYDREMEDGELGEPVGAVGSWAVEGMIIEGLVEVAFLRYRQEVKALEETFRVVPIFCEKKIEACRINLLCQIPIYPTFEIIEVGCMFPNDLSLCFYRTMKSSQLQFDQQAEIFGHEEGVDEPSFQGFLATANFSEANLKERASAGLERVSLSQQRKVIKGGPTDGKSCNSSRRLSGSRYALNISKGYNKAAQSTYSEEDSINLIKRTLHKEFEQLPNTFENGINKHEAQEISKDNPISDRPYTKPQRIPELKLPYFIIQEADTEEVTQSRYYRSNEAADQKITPKSSAKKGYMQKSKTVSRDKSKPSSDAKDISGSCLRGSLKKGIYKILASSTNEAEVSDILFIKEQLEEDFSDSKENYQKCVAKDDHDGDIFDPRRIVDQIKATINERYEPMVSEKYSSYIDDTGSMMKIEFTGRKTNHMGSRFAQSSYKAIKEQLVEREVPNIGINQAESPKKELKEINEEMKDIEKIIEQVGLIGLGIFQDVEEKCISKAQRNYSSTASKGLNINQSSAVDDSSSNQPHYCSTIFKHHNKLEFSAYERWYANEKNINLANIRSKSEFRDRCIKSSCKEREERARYLLERQESPKNSCKDDAPFNLEEMNDSLTDAYKRYTIEMPLSMAKDSDVSGHDKNIEQNDFFNLLLIQFNIQNESNRVINLLGSCPGFKLTSFIATLFTKYGTGGSSKDCLKLHRNSFYNVIKRLGSKCPPQVFDSYWGLKFGKLVVSPRTLADELFDIDLSAADLNETVKDKDDDFDLLSPTAKSLLVLLFDLSIKGEIRFNQEKASIGISQIMSFCRLCTPEHRGDLRLEDLLEIPQFSSFLPHSLQGIGRRLDKSTQNRNLNAYNICILLS